MENLGRQILAGTALAGQEHRRGRTRRDFSEKRLHCRQSGRLADDAIEAVGLRLGGAQGAHFAPQLRGFERLRDEQCDLVEVERLVHVMVGALLDRFDRGLHAHRQSEDDRGVGIAPLMRFSTARLPPTGRR